MRSLEIRTQRIFNNLIQQNQKLGSDSVLQQSSTMSSAQGPASRAQRTTLASRVQEFRFADQRKVKLFSSIIFLPLLCFKKKQEVDLRICHCINSYKFHSVSVDDIKKHKFQQNYNKIFNLFKFIIICFTGQQLKEFVNKELYL